MEAEARIPRWEIERLVDKSDRRLLVFYGRASGHGQHDDLDIQIRRLQAWAASERKGQETLELSDIGSGLTASRRRLQRLLRPASKTKSPSWRLRTKIA